MSYVFVRAFFFFLAKTTFKLLEHCSVHISEFIIHGGRWVGLCTNVSFLSANCLCKYALANILGSFYFAIV